MTFRITTWPERATPPDVAYIPTVIGRAFAERDLAELGSDPGDLDGWVRRGVTRLGERTQITVRTEILQRQGDDIFEQLADAAGPDRIAGSAIFVDITGDREPVRIGREYFLRFASLPMAGEVDFVFRLGPLDLAEHPHDLWFTRLGPRHDAHLDQVDDLLNGAKWRHPADGMSFIVGRPGAQLSIEGYAIEVQDLAFRAYHAALVTLIEMVLDPDRPDTLRHGFDAARLADPPPRSVVDAWCHRSLPSPSTAAQVLDTTFGLLLRGSGGSAPHLEVRPEASGGTAFWQLGRGILGAICLQAVHAVSDGVPVRPCARCGRLFQRQDEGQVSPRSQGTTRVRFCSDRCARAQAQQRYRERRRRGY